MKPKFKIGDIVDITWGGRRKIVDIILEKKTIHGNWRDGQKYITCYYDYVLSNTCTGKLTLLSISKQNNLTLVSSEPDNTVSSCPACGGEMKDKYSEYVGGNIKKCKSCGWC